MRKPLKHARIGAGAVNATSRYAGAPVVGFGSQFQTGEDVVSRAQSAAPRREPRGHFRSTYLAARPQEETDMQILPVFRLPRPKIQVTSPVEIAGSDL